MSAIVALLNTRGVLPTLRREGARLFGPCPVHGGDNPRAFVVDLQGDRWYCFTRCRRGGGPVGLAQALDLVPPDALSTVREPPRPFVPYRRALRLDPHSAWLASKGIGPAVAVDREVGEWHGMGMLAGCVAVRLHDPSGEPLGYAGRRRDPDEATRRGKWSFPRALPKGRLLYGLHRVRGTRVVLTECPWGVLRLAQLGVHAVALLGVALSPEQRRLLEPFREVLVLMDGDPAGRAAAVSVVRALGERAHVVSLPDGADPDDLTDAALAIVASQRAPPAPVIDGGHPR